MIDYAPGMRTIIRYEEWMVKKIEKNNMGNQALHCIGISPLVKDKEVIFLTDLENITVVNPAEVKLVLDTSSHFRKTQLYLESQWRQKIPTDTDLHIGDQAAMDLMPYQLEPAQISLRGYRRSRQNAGSRYSDERADCTWEREAHPCCDGQEHDDAVPERDVESLHYSARAPRFQENP